MKSFRASLFILLVALSPSMAQQVETKPVVHGDLVVKTVPLHHLTSAEAVKLLSPYSLSPGGGVFEVSAKIRAVTIRETPKIYAEMMAVLGQYDRDPASVTLNFQLIAAENTNTRDPGVAGLDSLLRGVLKYSGYRLLTTSVATASEGGYVTQTLSADGETFTLQVSVSDLRTDGNDASVHLNVALNRNAGPVPSSASTTGERPVTVKMQGPFQVLSTGVTVPVGQTVVLGTSATDVGQRALILTVRPQLTQAKR
jgi:hypothetical protein